MPIDLASYKQFADEDIGRPNAYEIYIEGMPEYMQIFCVKAQLPEQNMGVAPAYFQSRELKLAGDLRYGLWNAEFYGATRSGSLAVYKELCKWFNIPRDPVSNYGSASPSEYWKRVEIVVQDYSRYKEIQNIILWDAWITQMPSVDLSYESQDELLKIGVQIAFSEMENDASREEGRA